MCVSVCECVCVCVCECVCECVCVLQVCVCVCVKGVCVCVCVMRQIWRRNASVKTFQLMFLVILKFAVILSITVK